jgi:NADH-quinone oxidoreductase subunit J
MPGSRAKTLGGLLSLVALGFAFPLVSSGADLSGGMFVTFASVCLISAVCMISNKNPVYAALWFAVVTLAVCGLFLLQSAPFLAAASIVVYAGAIIVTFLFVIMLAQQSGKSGYDQTSRQPFIASVMAFTLLGLMLVTFQNWGVQRVEAQVAAQQKATDAAMPTAAVAPPPVPSTSAPAPLGGTGPAIVHEFSRIGPDEKIGHLRGLGRALFSDFLYAVEIAGTLLLIASIGAIAMAPRRAQGTL